MFLIMNPIARTAAAMVVGHVAIKAVEKAPDAYKEAKAWYNRRNFNRKISSLLKKH